MAVEIKLVGFGDDRPPRFGGRNRLQVEIETPASVRALLHAAGIEEAADLIAMDAATVIPPERWDDREIPDQATLVVLSAIEGG